MTWWDDARIEGVLTGEGFGGSTATSPYRTSVDSGGLAPSAGTTASGWYNTGISGTGNTSAPSPLPSGGAPPANSGDIQSRVMALLQGKPPTIASLLSVEPQLNAMGITLTPNKTLGPDGKPTNYDLRLPNGQGVDILQGASRGGVAWQWLTGNGAGGNTAPYAGTFTGGGQYPLASVMGSGFMQPWTTPFAPPDPNKIADNPAYQFRLQQGNQAIERAAASKGTLLTGGTLKDLTGFSQGLASTEYDNAYQRALGEYQQAYGIYNNNGNTQFSRLSSLVNRGAQAGAAAAGVNSAFGEQGGSTYMGIGNAQAAGQAASGAAWGGAARDVGSTIGQAYTLGGLYGGGTPPYYRQDVANVGARIYG